MIAMVKCPYCGSHNLVDSTKKHWCHTCSRVIDISNIVPKEQGTHK